MENKIKKYQNLITIPFLSIVIYYFLLYLLSYIGFYKFIDKEINWIILKIKGQNKIITPFDFIIFCYCLNAIITIIIFIFLFLIYYLKNKKYIIELFISILILIVFFFYFFLKIY
jgi:hypothetical protein